MGIQHMEPKGIQCLYPALIITNELDSNSNFFKKTNVIRNLQTNKIVERNKNQDALTTAIVIKSQTKPTAEEIPDMDPAIPITQKHG